MKWFACAVFAWFCFTVSACGGGNNALGGGHDGGATDSSQTALDGGAETGSGGRDSSASCGAAVACGTAGATYEECTTNSPGGECAAIIYQTSDGHSFTCTGCSDCSQTQQQLAAYCGSQPPGDGGTDAGQGEGGTTCLAPVSCGSEGLTYKECTTTDNGGACASIAYDVTNSNVYTCASCSDCAAAIQQLDAFCSAQGTPTTSCTAMTQCESSPLTFDKCTTSLGDACQSVAYHSSDGQTFTCSSCTDCTAALSGLDAYCMAQTAPVTTCGASSACGIGGATYAQCTTSQGEVCDSVAYTTSTGQIFTCASCGNCTAALTSVETYCASLTATGGVVLFGGFDATGAGLADTWTWNGSTWTSSAATGPAARGDAMGASLAGQFVVYGGISATTATTNYGDTWAWTGSAWGELATTGPTARFGGVMATMGTEMVLFGGDDTLTLSTDLADTWLWSAGGWASPSVG